MIEELYREHGERIYSRLAFATGSPEAAADLTQATFERMLRQPPAQDPVARLNTIAEGLLLNYFRDESRNPAFPVGSREDLDRIAQGEAWTYEILEFRTGFDSAVRTLPEPEREAFFLTELRGVSDREAAGLLGVSHMTVNRRAAVAITNLREELTL